MKKKLLSLVLAGAMVASTSVSAFAETLQTESSQQTPVANISQTPSNATNPQNFSVTDTPAEAEVTIDGKIANGSNKLPSSTISVSVPTAASFTVNKDGDLIGSNINITNQSNEEIEVLAYNFNDTTGDQYIKVVDSTALADSNDRKQVSLRLKGNKKTVSLVTSNTNTNSGIYELNTTNEISNENDRVIGTVTNAKALTLELEGDAVKKGSNLPEAIKDKFTLTLKLRKKVQ